MNGEVNKAMKCAVNHVLANCLEYTATSHVLQSLVVSQMSGGDINQPFDKQREMPVTDKPVKYELTIKEFETIIGVTKLLVRKDKRLEVKIPSGIDDGTKVVLPNALKITDGKVGDILILIKVSPVEKLNLQTGTSIDLIFQTCLHEIGGAKNSDVRHHVERLSLMISRDIFFQAVIWAVWVSGMSRKAAAGFRRNNEGKFRNMDFMKFATLDALQLKAFMEDLHGNPIPRRAEQKWQAIHYIATWLKGFSSEKNFRDKVFQGKCKGSDLDETDAVGLKNLRLPFIRATNANYLVKTLGGKAVKEDRWIKALLEWGKIGLEELEAKLQGCRIPLGFFDTAFWCYCEMFIHRTELFHQHFSDKFGFLKN